MSSAPGLKYDERARVTWLVLQARAVNVRMLGHLAAAARATALGEGRHLDRADGCRQARDQYMADARALRDKGRPSLEALQALAGKADAWETVNTLALVPGDVLDCHGSLFRLVAWTVDAGRALELAGKRIECAQVLARHGMDSQEYANYREREENLRAFSTEYLGPVYGEPGREAIPRHWRSGWTVQGNHRATWRRLVKP